jgi:hypothetical protein
MPTVRTLTPQVSPTPLPAVRRTAASTPAAEGAPLQEARARKFDALAGLGGAVAQPALDTLGRMATQARQEQERQIREAKQQADELAVLAADNQMAAWERDRIFDPQKGALTIKGKDAIGLPEQIDTEYDKTANDVAATLSTPAQQVAFARIRNDRQQRVALTIRRHVDDQIQRYTAEEFKAKVDNVVDEAQRHALDPDMVKETLNSGEATIKTFAPQLGFGPEAVKDQVRALRSTVHEGVIRSMLSQGQTTAARVYFEGTQGEIAADRLDDVRNALKTGSTKATAQKEADRIQREGGTLTEQRDKAKAIEDPDVRDETLNYLEHEATVRASVQRATDEAQSRAAYDAIDQTHDVRSIPPAVWANMSGGERSAARSYAKNLAEGVDVTTDLKAYYTLYQTAMDDPATFAKLDLYAMAKAKLSKSDFEELTKVQVAIRNKDPKADALLDGPSTSTQIFEATAKHAGIDPNSGDSYALRKRWDDSVATEQRVTGKKLGIPEQQKILDRLIMEAPGTSPWSYFKPWTWGSTKHGYEVTIDDIPQADRLTIVEILRRNHQPVTETTILDLYLRTKEAK